MDFKDKRVLVTGAGGFIGAALIRQLLALGARVYAQVRPCFDGWRLEDLSRDIEILEVDLTDFQGVAQALASLKPHFVFHLAVSRDTDNWNSLVAVNIAATVNLLESTPTKTLERFIHAGSSTEYGLARSPYREDACPQPVSLFGASKVAGTLFTLRTAHEKGFPAVVLRPFYVYGPWELPGRLITKAIGAALSDEELPITAPGFTHDPVFVDDAVEALLLAATARDVVGEIFNVASGKKTTNEELIAEISCLMGHRIRTRVGGYPHRKWESTDWEADVTKAREILGWQPRHSLAQGLRKTIEWVRAHAGRS